MADPDDTPRPAHPVRTVLAVLGPRRRMLVLLSAFTVVGGLSEAVLLVVVAQIAIAVTEANTVSEVGLGVLTWGVPRTIEGLYVMAGVLVLLRLAAQVGAGLVSSRLVTSTQFQLRRDLVEAFVAADWATQAREPEGHAQELVTTHVNRAGASVATLSGTLSSLVNFIAMMGSALVVDPVTAGLMVVAVGVLFLVFRPVTAYARGLAAQRAAAGQELAQRVTETVSSALEIRSTNVAPAVLDDLHRRSDTIQRLERRGQLIASMLSTSYQSVALVALLTALAAMYAFGSPVAGALGAILLLLLRSLSYSQALQSSYHGLGEVAPFTEEALRERDRYRAAAPPSGTKSISRIDRIQLAGVDFAYEPGSETLRDIDLALERGQMLGVIGPSGAGKSTLIQLLLGLRPPTDGRYLVNGIDRDDIELSAWFDRVAFVPQEPRLIAGSVAENIAFWRPHDEADIVDAARRAHLHDDVMVMPDGYATDVGPRGTRLSGGQKQRATIARALLGAPDLLVLDEPTSALDLRSEALLEETFRDLRGHLTLVVIAHRLSTVSACDQLLVIEGGRIEALGTPADVEATSPFFREALARTRAGFLPEGEGTDGTG